VIERYGLRFEVDEQLRGLMQAVGSDVSEYNGSAGWTLPAVATFVIDRDGVVRFARVRGDWRERAEPADVVAALGHLQ
jgi:peroxiredoxin